jgi:hypothetical protein
MKRVGLTWQQAREACIAGVAIRHGDMSPGWKLVLGDRGDFFAINPHTGSDYQYNVTDFDMDKNDWAIVP